MMARSSTDSSSRCHCRRPGRRWLARRDALRREILADLGIDDLVPPRWDLAVQSKGTLRRDGYRIEKVTFQSYPGMAIPALVYVPDGIRGACRASSPSPDTPRSARRRTTSSGGTSTSRSGAASCCATTTTATASARPATTRITPPAGIPTTSGPSPSRADRRRRWRCSMRSAPWTSSRPGRTWTRERIGFTGESGGGNSTYWVAALDPRVVLAVPVSAVTTFDYWIRTDVNWDWHQRPPGIRRSGGHRDAAGPARAPSAARHQQPARHGRPGVPPARGGEVVPVGEARLWPPLGRGRRGALRIGDRPRLPGGQARAALSRGGALAASAVPQGRPGTPREGGGRRRPAVRAPAGQPHRPSDLPRVAETAPASEQSLRSGRAARVPARAARLAGAPARDRGGEGRPGGRTGRGPRSSGSSSPSRASACRPCGSSPPGRPRP